MKTLTLRQQFDKAVAHAIKVLLRKPGRYNFQTTSIPATPSACGCLWGFIGEGMGLRGGSISDATQHFSVYSNQLYEAMRAVDAPEERGDWHDDAKTAAEYLPRAAALVKKHIPARVRSKLERI
jgi:hypothetical protein